MSLNHGRYFRDGIPRSISRLYNTRLPFVRSVGLKRNRPLWVGVELDRAGRVGREVEQDLHR